MKETVKLKLSQGSAVEVEYEGRWRKATVAVLQKSVVLIHFEGRNANLTFYLHISFIDNTL